MRLTLASSAASERLTKERSTPGSAGEVAVKATSLPYAAARMSAPAVLIVPCAPGYEGSGAVADSGVQFGSPVVSGLSSASAPRIAVTGRQKRYAYLAS